MPHGGRQSAHGHHATRLHHDPLHRRRRSGHPRRLPDRRCRDGVHAVYDAAGRKIEEDSDGRNPRYFTYDPAGNVTETITPRGDTIRMSYDLMNRLTQRITPEVQYDTVTCGPFEDPLFGSCPSPYRFPLYPNNDQDGLTIPQDTAVFVYDAMGNTTRAWNIYARVSRTYNPDGTVATDTLRIRDYTNFYTGSGGGGDTCSGDMCVESTEPIVSSSSSGPGDDANFTTFVYVITHAYDLNKRRTSTTYPPNVAPTTGAQVSYSYNTFGALGSVQNMFGNTHSIGYDSEGRPTSLTQPGSVSESRTYDDDSRLIARSRSVGDIDDNLTYDARGKISQVTAGTNGEETALNFYSALGHLAANKVQRSSPGAFLNIQEFTLDANGSASWRRENKGSLDPSYDYQLSPGGRIDWIRLDRADLINQGGGQEGIYSDTLRNQYDAAGNAQYHWRRQQTATDGVPSYSAKIAQTHYYASDEKLRVTQRYNYDGDKQRGAYQEFWYDALGRRVMIRTRTDSTNICNWNCDPGVTRVVWDGDQILMELRASGTGSHYDSGTQYGRVSYTHGGGIDQPFDVIKGSTVLVPYTNWRGLYAGATDVTGTWCSNPPSGSCDGIEWPGHNRRAFLDNKDLNPDPGDWWGSLIQGQTDQSGLLYRRNRYYDPSTGQFTQEDPIGIAGGLNLYGYAGGDPVNFSDPFGLCPPPPGEFDPLCTAGNVAAGFGDAITFGGTRLIREWMGTNDQIDESSGSYLAGEITATGVSIALGAGTAQAIRSGSTVATSAPARAGTTALLRSRVGQALFGPGRGLNTGPTVRIGAGRGRDGRAVFRVAGEAVERAAGRGHVDLVDLGSFEDYIRIVTGGR